MCSDITQNLQQNKRRLLLTMQADAQGTHSASSFECFDFDNARYGAVVPFLHHLHHHNLKLDLCLVAYLVLSLTTKVDFHANAKFLLFAMLQLLTVNSHVFFTVNILHSHMCC